LDFDCTTTPSVEVEFSPAEPESLAGNRELDELAGVSGTFLSSMTMIPHLIAPHLGK